MQTQAYILAIVLLGTIVASLSVGNSMVYGSSDDENDDENNDENDPCYKAGFEAGSSGSFNQTQQSNCGSTGQAYYEGFISGCISSDGGDYSACDAKTR
ncbi:MAG: hypothetical protein ACRD8W_32490 [Nitrososphaeraceae archaeon]